MLKIRLQRTGRINQPSYRIVVIEHARAAKSGNFVEQVGSYNPKSKERILSAERITYWLSKGAQASPTVHNMLISAGIIKGKKINVLPQKTLAAGGSQSAETAGSTAPAAAAVSEDASKEVEEGVTEEVAA